MKKKTLLSLLFCVFSVSASVFWMLSGNLSVVRLGFSAVICLLGAAAFLAYTQLEKLRDHALRFLTVGTVSLFLFFGCSHYFDNPSFDRIAAYIRQARPLLCFFALHAVLIACLLFFKNMERLSAEKEFVSVILIFLSTALLMLAFCPLRKNYYPSHDYAIFSYIGQQILKGKTPYSQLWDHKPPVIFYINALGLLLGQGSLVGIWLLEWICLFIGSWLFYKILRKFSAWSIALSVTCLSILHYVRLFDFGNYTEEFSLFFAMCGLGLYVLRPRSLKRALVNGFLCGLAFTCKQNTIGMWCGLVLLEAIPIFQKKQPLPLDRALVFASGFLFVNIAWAAFFAANGVLSDYWDVAFRFNFIYSEHSSDSRFACALTTLTFLPTVSPFLLMAFICWGILLWFKEEKQDNTVRWALLTLPIELIFAGLSGMNYQHYFILCVPPACVLLAAGASRVQYLKRYIPILFCLASFTLIPLYKDNYTPRTPSAYTKARDYLSENTDPDRSILVWGSRSAVYVMAERYAPTAYFNERPLYLFGDQVRGEQWDELLSDIRSDPPQVIVYTHDSALPFIRFDQGECKFPDNRTYSQEVYQYFCEQYRYETTINEGAQDAWEVYRKK